METERLKIFIVDDNRSFRDAAKQYLKNELNHEIIGEASNGAEFLEKVKTLNPDIVLMDLQMPEIDGIAAAKKWNIINSTGKVLAVTMFTEKAYLLRLIESGFKGCIFKTRFFADIVKAINTVYHGELYFPIDLPID